MKKINLMPVVFSTLLVVGFVSSCSTSTPRTKWTDKNMRVMIDPDSIDEENYVQIQQALVSAGNFTIVDRARGMNAMKKEQERTQRVEADRFADKEKWSHWGKMYGVGSIVVGHLQCRKENVLFNRTKMYLDCHQFLSMIDSNTGEVIVAVEGQNEGPASYDLSYIQPDWNKVTEKLMDAYPKEYRANTYSKEVITYQEISSEHAQRQKELVERKKEAEKAPDEEKKNLQIKIKELEDQLSIKSETASGQPK
jgi:hypothetical protein